MACEVIEYLPKSKHKLFLLSLEDVSNEKVIISTPNYRYPQNEIRGNPYEKHISAWKDVDFKREGYKVKGLGIQIREKIFPARIPLIEKIFAKVVLFGKFTKFAELIVGIKDLR